MTINPDGGRVTAPSHSPPTLEPELKEYSLLDRDDRPFEIYARLLGFSSSHREDHEHDPYFIDREEMTHEAPLLRERLSDLSDRYDIGAMPTNVFSAAHESLTDYIRFFGSDFRGHPENVRRYATGRQRCSACRWFEVRIFSVEGEYIDTTPCTCDAGDAGDAGDADDHDISCGLGAPRARYLVLTYGRTVVPGEINKRRAVWTNSNYEVISILTQRQRTDGTGQTGSRQKFMPATSERALAQAASVDPNIERAFNARSSH